MAYPYFGKKTSKEKTLRGEDHQVRLCSFSGQLKKKKRTLRREVNLVCSRGGYTKWLKRASTVFQVVKGSLRQGEEWWEVPKGEVDKGKE